MSGLSVPPLDLGVRRFRHGGEITAVAVSPDGTCLATAAALPDEITLWSLPDGPRRADIASPADALAFSPDGSVLVSAYTEVRRWDVRTGRALAPPWEVSASHPMALSTNGHWLAAKDPTVEGVILVGHPTPGSEPQRLVTAHRTLTAMAFTPDGRHLVVAGDGGIQEWALPPGIFLWLQRPVMPMGERITALAVSPDGVTLARGGASGVSLDSLDDPAETRRLGVPGSLDAIECVAFSPDGVLLATGTLGSQVVIWQVATGRRLGTFRSPRGARVLAFLPDNRTLACQREHAVRFHDVTNGRLRESIGTLDAHDGALTAMAASPDGRFLATTATDHAITLWDLVVPGGSRRLEGHTNTVNCVAFAPAGELLVTGAADGDLRTWAVPGGAHRDTVGSSHGGITDVTAVAFSPDGTALWSTGRDATLRLRDPVTGAERERFTVRAHGGIRRMAYLDAHAVVVLRADGVVQVLEPATESERWRASGLGIDVLAASPDGRWVAVTRDEVVQVLNGTDGRVIAGFRAGRVSSLAFGPRGLLACTQSDGPPCVWALATDEAYGLPAVAGQPCVACFLPDGRLALGRTDGSATVVTVQRTDLVEEPAEHREPDAWASEATALLTALARHGARTGYRDGPWKSPEGGRHEIVLHGPAGPARVRIERAADRWRVAVTVAVNRGALSTDAPTASYVRLVAWIRRRLSPEAHREHIASQRQWTLALDLTDAQSVECDRVNDGITLAVTTESLPEADVVHAWVLRAIRHLTG